MEDPIAENRIEFAAVAVARLVTRGALGAPSVGQVAKIVNCDPSTLVKRFGTKLRMYYFVTRYLGERWVQRLEARIRWQPRAVLATSCWEPDPVLVTTRVWLALCELGRADDLVGRAVTELRAAERRALLRMLADRDQVTQDAWVALVRGLQVELGAVEAMPEERAERVVDWFLLTHGGPDLRARLE